MDCVDFGDNKCRRLLEVVSLPLCILAPVQFNRVILVFYGAQDAQGVELHSCGLQPLPQCLDLVLPEELHSHALVLQARATCQIGKDSGTDLVCHIFRWQGLWALSWTMSVNQACALQEDNQLSVCSYDIGEWSVRTTPRS